MKEQQEQTFLEGFLELLGINPKGYDEAELIDQSIGEDGRIYLGAYLFENNFKRENGRYIISGQHFNPSRDYSAFNFMDIEFRDCSFEGCDLTDTVFDGCKFTRTNVRNFDGATILNHHWGSQTGTSFVNTTIIGGSMSGAEFNRCNFTNAQIEATLPSYLSGASHDSNYYRTRFILCTFKSTFINKLYLSDVFFGQCAMDKMRMTNMIFRGVTIHSSIEKCKFENITVYEPYNRPNTITFGMTNKYRIRMHQSEMINCNWRAMNFEVHRDYNETHAELDNFFQNTNFGCAQLKLFTHNKNGVARDPQIFKGNDMQRMLVNQLGNNASSSTNNFAPQRWGGIPCVNTDGGRATGFEMTGIVALWIVVSLAFIFIVRTTYKTTRRRWNLWIRDQQLSNFREIVDATENLPLEIAQQYQSGMMKFVRNVFAEMSEESELIGQYSVMPKGVINMLLNYLPKINLDNNALRFRDQLEQHREDSWDSIFNFNAIASDNEDEVIIEFDEDDGENIKLISL